MPGEVTQHKKSQREFYVPALGGKYYNPTGGSGASPMV